MNLIRPIVIVAFLAALALPGFALAQGSCAEGMTASGECVDPGLAAGARQTAIIISQTKISYTAYPVLPNGDTSYRYPNQLNPDQFNSSTSEAASGRGSSSRRRGH